MKLRFTEENEGKNEWVHNSLPSTDHLLLHLMYYILSAVYLFLLKFIIHLMLHYISCVRQLDLN
jgi:hypothetical protein